MPSIPLPRCLGLLGILGVISAVLPSIPQARPPELPQFNSPDLALVAASGAGYITVAVDTLLDHPWLRQPPPRLRESLTELRNDFQRRHGVPLEQLQRFTLAFPTNRMEEPVGLFYSRANKGFDPAAIQRNLPDWKKEQIGARTLLRSPDDRAGLLMVEERLMAAGRPEDLTRFLQAGDGDRTLTAGLAEAEAGAHLVAGIRPYDALMWLTPRPAEPRPGAEIPTLNELLRELPAEALPYKPLFLAKSVTLSLRLAEDSAGFRTMLDYGKAEQAVRDGEASFRVALYVLRETLPRLWLREIDRDPRAALEMVRAVEKTTSALQKTDIQVEEGRLKGLVTLPAEPPLVSVLLRQADLTPPTSAERQNHLKQVGLALHGYHDAMLGFPGTAIYSPQGKPLLSWRVAILPYIEEANLFRQFKLDEPWDGPNNIKLLEKMPRVYAPPRGVKAEPGHTFLQAFSGPNTMFDARQDFKQGGLARGVRFTDVTDGTSNTAMVGESGKAVPWTKPDDILCDGKAVPPLGCIPGSERCFVLMGDGSVRAITTKPPLELFNRLVNRHDGQVLDPEDLRPGR